VITMPGMGDHDGSEWVIRIDRDQRSGWCGIITIVWNDLSIIAYEFEREAKTLLQVVQEDGLSKGIASVLEALKELYRGARSQIVHPQSCLKPTLHRVVRKNDPGVIGDTVAALLSGKPHPRLNESVELKVGCEHGDLHARNILLSPRGPVIIDFAHYRALSDRGVPLLDLAKLVIDLWAFGAPGYELPDVFLADDLRTALASDG